MIHDLGDYRFAVFRLILISALLVVAARALAPFEVGKDQSSQLEAAQRLVEGRGVTTTNDLQPGSLDITEAPNPKYLTWWPPGFTLMVAGFLLIGFPLLFSLKVIYVSATLAGWLGWALLASPLLAKPLRHKAHQYPVQLVIALLIPIFFTPRWGGTDIFLWMGAPFMILSLRQTVNKRSGIAWAALAGLCLGSLYAIRYASLFLGLGAALILFQINFPNVKSFLKRATVFVLSSLVIIAPVVIYTRRFSRQESIAPSLAHPTYGGSNIYDTVVGFFHYLPVTSNLIFGHPLFEQVSFTLNSNPLVFVFGVACLLVILLLPLAVLTSRTTIVQRAQEDLALTFSFLPLSLVVFLIAVSVSLLSIRRYYEPIALCGVFVFYQIASARTTYRTVKVVSTAVVIMFMAYMCLYLPALAMMPEKRDEVVGTILSFTPAKSTRLKSTSQSISYPSYQIYSRKESARLKLRQLHQAYPQALFFVEEYGYFIYDGFRSGGPTPGENLRIFPRKKFWERAYTSKAVKVFWVVNPRTKLDFIPNANLRMIHSDPFEETNIFESNFQAGYKFSGLQIASSALLK
jgi:hypothetical protein